MNSVAGFKAVDAEGNELGIMSLADITAAIKESIMQDAAMARSVATLSEASTQAASDTYENRLPQQTDLTWARGLDSNGNPILISKESLASVVGGLLGDPISFKGDAGDVNETTEPGYYGINTTGAGTINAPSNLGTLIVLNGKVNYAGGGKPIVQIQITNTASEIYVRGKWVNSWYQWKKITLSSVE